MYFDVSKLYFSNHIINDSLSDGSKGYFANTLTELIDAVENEDHSHFGELLGGDWSTPPTLRFKGKCGDNEEKVFNYFYFVEYPKFFRPYKWEERHLIEGKWVRNIHDSTELHITETTFSEGKFKFNGMDISQIAFYEFLDGTPCGVELTEQELIRDSWML